MNNKQNISNLFDILYHPTVKETDVTISFSQYSLWATCPLRWKLKYIDKVSIYNPSIAATYGTAMHITLQEWIQLALTTSVSNSIKKIGISDLFKTKLQETYTTELKLNNNIHFSNKDEMLEFYNDGVSNLEYLKKNFSQYFSPIQYKLIGIELPIYTPAVDGYDIIMKGFIDIVLLDIKTNRIKLIDIKTSRNGWSNAVKKDYIKTSQLILYKYYFSKQFDIDINNIDIEYFIIRRHMPEYETIYRMKPISKFVPANGSLTQRKVINNINTFIKSCFNTNGGYKTDAIYNKNPGDKNKNCKYCEFKKKMVLKDGSQIRYCN